MNYNILLGQDAYKSSHWKQYPPNTTAMFSYFESRGGQFGQTLFFGLQPILSRMVRGFSVADIEQAKTFKQRQGVPFPYDELLTYAKRFGVHAPLPLRIRAVPEGSIIPTHNVLMTVESTDPSTFWLASYFETMLVRAWYPITVATQSWHMRQLIKQNLSATSDNPEMELPFKLHDFGSRGVSSEESAGIGGCAHLVSFKGSDTDSALIHASEFYGEESAGFSVPAAEHSTITAWGREGEIDAYRNMLTQFAKPGSVVAVVSDSYDLWNAIDNIWGGSLRDQVINSGATIVIRPDSGNPPEVVKACLLKLEAKFGSYYNKKGFKVLNNVRVIQGDGVNFESIREILRVTKDVGFSGTNIAFGSGGGLLQQLNRDTQKFAYKCSAAIVDGKWRSVFKDPITDPGKRSKSGRLDLVRRGGKYKTVEGSQPGSELVTMFENGKLTNTVTLTEVRQRVVEFEQNE